MPSTHIYECPSVPLNIVGWQRPQVTKHAKALVGLVNNGSWNLITGQVGYMFNLGEEI